MNSFSPSIPSPRALFWRDFKFQSAVKVGGFFLFVAAGIFWVAQPVPSAVKVENSPAEVWILKWGPMVAIAVAVIALLIAVRRFFWVRKVLSHGIPIKGIVVEKDVYSYEESASETSTAFNRPKRYTYFVIVRFPCRGADQKIRVKLPHSPSTYGIFKDKEVDLIALESVPHQPLIREVYLGRF